MRTGAWILLLSAAVLGGEPRIIGVWKDGHVREYGGRVSRPEIVVGRPPADFIFSNAAGTPVTLLQGARSKIEIAPGAHRTFRRGVKLVFRDPKAKDKELSVQRNLRGHSTISQKRNGALVLSTRQDSQCTIKNYNSFAVWVHVYNKRDKVRLVPRTKVRLNPQASFREPRGFHLRLRSIHGGPALGEMLNIDTNWVSLGTGGRRITPSSRATVTNSTKLNVAVRWDGSDWVTLTKASKTIDHDKPYALRVYKPVLAHRLNTVKVHHFVYRARGLDTGSGWITNRTSHPIRCVLEMPRRKEYAQRFRLHPGEQALGQQSLDYTLRVYRKKKLLIERTGVSRDANVTVRDKTEPVWRPAPRLPKGVTFRSSLSASRRQFDTLITGIGTDKNVWMATVNAGGWSPWICKSNWTGLFGTAPVFLFSDKNDKKGLLVAVDKHRKIATKHASPEPNTFVVESWKSLDGTPGTPPAALAVPQVCVFVRRFDDNKVWGRFQRKNGTWNDWGDLGGPFVAAPAICATKTGFVTDPKWHMHIFAHNRTGLYILTYHRQSKTWGKWTKIGGRFTASPAVASNNTRSGPVVLGGGKKQARWLREITVAARGLDGSFSTKRFKDGDWSDWSDLGGRFRSDPTVFYIGK